MRQHKELINCMYNAICFMYSMEMNSCNKCIMCIGFLNSYRANCDKVRVFNNSFGSVFILIKENTSCLNPVILAWKLSNFQLLEENLSQYLLCNVTKRKRALIVQELCLNLFSVKLKEIQRLEEVLEKNPRNEDKSVLSCW